MPLPGEDTLPGEGNLPGENGFIPDSITVVIPPALNGRRLRIERLCNTRYGNTVYFQDGTTKKGIMFQQRDNIQQFVPEIVHQVIRSNVNFLFPYSAADSVIAEVPIICMGRRLTIKNIIPIALDDVLIAILAVCDP